LVRYDPESDEAMKRRQAARLRELADYLHKSNQHFMFELLAPMTHEQSDRLEGDQNLYDRDLRPSLMITAIKEFQNAGVEPDVWKIEGLDWSDDCAPWSPRRSATGAPRWAASFSAAAPMKPASSQGCARWRRCRGSSASPWAAPRSGTRWWRCATTRRARKGGRDYRQSYVEWVRTFEDARRG
jgi:hypothetical protein